jgi:hypothetical protein
VLRNAGTINGFAQDIAGALRQKAVFPQPVQPCRPGVMWALQYGCLAAERVGSLHLKAVFYSLV